MSMDDMERSSLSINSAASGVIIADSVSEKPIIWTINEEGTNNSMELMLERSVLTRIHDSLNGWRQRSFLKGDLIQIQYILTWT